MSSLQHFCELAAMPCKNRRRLPVLVRLSMASRGKAGDFGGGRIPVT